MKHGIVYGPGRGVRTGATRRPTAANVTPPDPAEELISVRGTSGERYVLAHPKELFLEHVAGALKNGNPLLEVEQVHPNRRGWPRSTVTINLLAVESVT